MQLANAGRAQRREPRQKVFRLVTLGVLGIRHRAHILDLSQSGARVHCDVAMTPGHGVTLCIGERILKARVVWTNDKRIGIAFHVPLPADAVEEIAAGDCVA